MIYIGIDPGLSGGIAYIAVHNAYTIKLPEIEGLEAPSITTVALKMPDTEADTAEFFKQITINKEVKALIEKVHSMPKQGVTSSFTFGRNYGFLRGCLISHGISFDEVQPAIWQKTLGCLTKGDKNVSKAKAQQLFPELKVTHATADALLIAEYLRRRELGTEKETKIRLASATP